MTVSDLITRVRALGISSTDISDTDLTTIINSVVLKEYSAHRPIVFSTTFSTTKDQQDYSFPTGAESIIRIYWNPTISNSAWYPWWTEINRILKSETDFYAPSVVGSFLSLLNRFEDYFGGTWDIISTSAGVRKIRLIPCPSQSGLTVYAICGKAHSDVSTVPSTDESLFLDGVMAWARYRIEQRKGISGGFRAGSYAVTGSSATERRSVERALSQWRARLAIGGFVARS